MTTDFITKDWLPMKCNWKKESGFKQLDECFRRFIPINRAWFDEIPNPACRDEKHE